jgi:hypothetical protein
LFKKNITILSVALSMTLSLVFSSNSLARDLSYTSVDITYKQSNSGAAGSALQHGLSFGVSDNVFVAGSFTDGDYDFGGQVSAFDLVLGVHTEISENTDLVAAVSYAKSESELLSVSGEFEIFSSTVGIRSIINDVLEVSANLGCVDPTDLSYDTFIQLGAAFYATDALSFRIDFTTNDRIMLAPNTLNLSLRLDM